MKLITRDTDYAIRALCYMAKHKGAVVSADELVECLKMPRPFLRKILQILNKKKLVNSRKGKGGGFVLAVPPRKMSLLDLIEAFQRSIKLNDHTFKKRPCPHIKRCKVKEKIDYIEKLVLSELKAITIASLLK